MWKSAAFLSLGWTFVLVIFHIPFFLSWLPQWLHLQMVTITKLVGDAHIAGNYCTNEAVQNIDRVHNINISDYIELNTQDSAWIMLKGQLS